MKGYHQLTEAERIRIEVFLGEQLGIREIAERLNRAASTISREIKRYRNVDGTYRGSTAQRRARQQSRGRPCSLITAPDQAQPTGSNEWLYVREKLRQGWSPEIIAARYRMEHPGSRLCHETIYRYIYSEDIRSEKLWKYLARQQPRRYPRNRRAQQRAQQPTRPNIADRPQEAYERSEVGHWEADLLCFRQPGVVLHVVERSVRFGFALKLAGKHAKQLMDRLIAAFASLPAILRETVTFDNGSEFFSYEQLWDELGMRSYFCDPYAFWQKGTVENQNRALRRYLPRSTDLNGLSEQELIDIREELNDRPMKCLGFLTPREMLFSLTGLSVALHM